MTGPNDAGLPPDVTEILSRVEARVAAAPSITQIRELAARVEAASRASAMSLSEIRSLADIAVDRARQVEDSAARLAEMLRGAGDD